METRNNALRIGKIKKFISTYGTPLLFMLPYMLIFIIFFVYPFFYGIYISFYKWNIFIPEKTEFVGLSNYITILFGDIEGALPGAATIHKNFINGLKNTCLFVLLSVPLLIIIPLILALLLDIQPKGYKFFRTILFLPSILSVSAVCIIWKWQFDTNLGFVNGMLNLFNIDNVPWLQETSTAWFVIVLTTVWWTLGTNMVILGAGLKDVDKSLYEAAEIDGANYFQSLYYVAIPGVKNQVFLCLITTIIASFNVYGQVDILTGGGPSNTTNVLMMYIRGYAFGGNAQPGLAAAMSILLGIVIIIIGVIQNIVNSKNNKEDKYYGFKKGREKKKAN